MTTETTAKDDIVLLIWEGNGVDCFYLRIASRHGAEIMPTLIEGTQ
jgi:hypothetical protein